MAARCLTSSGSIRYTTSLAVAASNPLREKPEVRAQMQRVIDEQVGSGLKSLIQSEPSLERYCQRQSYRNCGGLWMKRGLAVFSLTTLRWLSVQHFTAWVDALFDVNGVVTRSPT